jgi:hypothetical protein
MRFETATQFGVATREVAEDIVDSAIAIARGWDTMSLSVMIERKGLPTFLEGALTPLFKWAGDTFEWKTALAIRLLEISERAHWVDKAGFTEDTSGFWENKTENIRMMLWGIVLYLIYRLNLFTVLPMDYIIFMFMLGVIAKAWGGWLAAVNKEGWIKGTATFALWYPVLMVWVGIIMPLYAQAVRRGSGLFTGFIPTPPDKTGNILRTPPLELYMSLIASVGLGSFLISMLLVSSFSFVGWATFVYPILLALAGAIGAPLLNYARRDSRWKDLSVNYALAPVFFVLGLVDFVLKVATYGTLIGAPIRRFFDWLLYGAVNRAKNAAETEKIGEKKVQDSAQPSA